MIMSQKMCNTLHSNFCPGDKFLQFSTLGWMMWNYATSTLANGCCTTSYDGSPLNPQDILFQLVDRYEISHLGVSPRYLTVLETAGYKPNQHYSLKSIKTIATAGSPLKADLYDWVTENIGEQVVSRTSFGASTYLKTDLLRCSGYLTARVVQVSLLGPTALGRAVTALSDPRRGPSPSFPISTAH